MKSLRLKFMSILMQSFRANRLSDTCTVCMQFRELDMSPSCITSIMFSTLNVRLQGVESSVMFIVIIITDTVYHISQRLWEFRRCVWELSSRWLMIAQSSHLVAPSDMWHTLRRVAFLVEWVVSLLHLYKFLITFCVQQIVLEKKSMELALLFGCRICTFSDIFGCAQNESPADVHIIRFGYSGSWIE